jgi:ATP-dependent exoDNAse (exonuclease V) alpha subunit
MSREWLWTAITRATSLDNVYFYEYTEPKLNTDLMLSYFKRRVEGYQKPGCGANRKEVARGSKE